MKDKLTKEIIEFISERHEISIDLIKPESRFIADLGIDSLDMMEMVFDLEDQYDLNMTCTIHDVQTIGDLVEILSSMIDEKNKIN